MLSQTVTERQQTTVVLSGTRHPVSTPLLTSPHTTIVINKKNFNTFSVSSLVTFKPLDRQLLTGTP